MTGSLSRWLQLGQRCRASTATIALRLHLALSQDGHVEGRLPAPSQGHEHEGRQPLQIHVALGNLVVIWSSQAAQQMRRLVLSMAAATGVPKSPDVPA